MRHASLFSGIGLFDLAASWMGWENVLQCEIDDFCRKQLRKHYPSTYLHDDITTLDGTQWKGKIDVLTGGFPCQPFSSAGKRRGDDDDRHLWPQMLRTIREIQPTWVVGENVGGLLTWEDGLVFEQVCSDLENTGYEVQSFCIPACAVDAPHRRDRLWIVAYHESKRRKEGSIYIRTNNESSQKTHEGWTNLWFCTVGGNIIKFKKEDEYFICGMDDGLPDRVDRLKALGNAIVPQVAFQIFQAISSASVLHSPNAPSNSIATIPSPF